VVGGVEVMMRKSPVNDVDVDVVGVGAAADAGAAVDGKTADDYG
jgi:hypothetical protein